jgi:GNAT superfamily N-acetyltransferase
VNPRIDRLRAIHRLETAAEMEEYDRIIAELANDEPLDPALLPDLFLSFFDETEGEEVMWSLLHLVEDFQGQAYASALVEALPRMMAQAREWGLLLLKRMLNSEPDRPLLRAAFGAGSPEQQQLVRELLREIVGKNAAFAEKAAQVTAQ